MKFQEYLRSVKLAGSHAKGTALRNSDIDLLLSYAPNTPGSLEEIQRSVADHFIPYGSRIRNVSVRIIYKGLTVDLVPARRSNTCDYLWQARFNTWLKTDVAEQTRYVRDSGLIDEILALKIWRRRHALRFPSFLMELAVIHALSAGGPIAEQFTSLLRFLATDFPTTRLLDPANSNNVVSDLLTEVEKLRIARTASHSVWGRF